MRTALGFAVWFGLGVATYELLRRPAVADEAQAWLRSLPGRFEAWAAEVERLAEETT